MPDSQPSLALVKLNGTKELRRARQLAQQLSTAEASNLKLCSDLGKPINLVAVRALLERDDCGTSINEEDVNGWTLLHHAAKAGDSDLCHLLAGHAQFDRGILTSTLAGKTPADIAREAGHSDLAASLGEDGSIPKKRRVSLVGAKDPAEAKTIAAAMVGETDFDVQQFMRDHDFARLGPIALTALVQTEKVEKDVVNFVDEDGWTALHYGVYERNIPLVREVAGSWTCPANAKNNAGETAFAFALLNGEAEIARKIARARLFDLSLHGLDTPMADGRTLAEAAAAKSAEIASQLPVWRLQNGKTQEDCDRLVQGVDFTKLNIAEDLGFQQINYVAIQAVLSAATAGKPGLVVTRKSAQSYTMLDHAVHDGKEEMVCTILDFLPNFSLAGAQHTFGPVGKKSDGNSILHLAIWKKLLRAVTRLLKHPQISTIIEKKNSAGTTPFAMAKEVGHLGITRLVEEEMMAQQLIKTTAITKCRDIIGKLREPLQCGICCDRPWDTAPLCGHVMCSTCIDTLPVPRKCPTCSKAINMNNCRKLFLP